MELITFLSIIAVIAGMIGFHEMTTHQPLSGFVRGFTAISAVFTYLLSDFFSLELLGFVLCLVGVLGGAVWRGPVSGFFQWREERRRQASIRRYEQARERQQLESMKIEPVRRVIGTFAVPDKQEQEQRANQKIKRIR